MKENIEQSKQDKDKYFTKKEILERLRWGIFAILAINFLITIGLIQAMVYYNGIPLLGVFLMLILSIPLYHAYKNFKKYHN
ncbi:MAG: hypothetical protein GF329_07720 [Candidatus Lokiarchaeota archaeon]|nr:hypothetical protein [Candidatus Lokiarchaeota archaeon]